MPEWMWGIIVIAGIFGIGWIWSEISDRGGKAGAAVDSVERVAEATGNVLVRVYGVVLVIVAIILFVITPNIWYLELLVLGYGAYLVLPGEKWVIW
ncbi:hypothetical protein ACXR2T_09270 [Leucobacter sp. HY1910]